MVVFSLSAQPSHGRGYARGARNRGHVSGDPKGDLERADESASKALALDPDWTWTHLVKGGVLRVEGRPEEAVPEDERALALDPSNVNAAGELGFAYANLGEFDKSLDCGATIRMRVRIAAGKNIPERLFVASS